MKFFTEEDFVVNKDLTVEVIEIHGENFIFVDDVFQYPDRVRDYVTRAGIKSNRNQHQQLEMGIGDTYLNGTNYYDGKFYVERVSEPTRTEVNLYQYMQQVLDVQLDPMRMFSWRVFNQFLEIDISEEKPFFWPHVDKCHNSMIYLNPHNHMGAGTSFYEKITHQPEGMEHVDTWKGEDEYKELFTVLDSYNTMVVFPGHIHHAMRTIPGVHKEHMRVTHIAFFGEKNQRIITP